jgi:1,4-alpha-glucan branching enzyme
VDVEALDAGRYAVRIYAPSARRVEIMGDFNEWSSTALTPAANGWWTVVTRITPGLRQMTVRIDGGQWTVPAGAHTEEDEYGAPVGVIIVR